MRIECEVARSTRRAGMRAKRVRVQPFLRAWRTWRSQSQGDVRELRPKSRKVPSGVKPQRKSGERGASLVCHFFWIVARNARTTRHVRPIVVCGAPGELHGEAGSQSAFTEPPRLLGAIDMRSNKARLKTTLAIMPGNAARVRRKRFPERSHQHEERSEQPHELVVA